MQNENEDNQSRSMKADIEDGFDRLAQALTNKLASFNLNGREFRVCLAVISKTYRYHKKEDWISNEQISNITGISSNHIATIKRHLIKQNVLIVNGKKLGLNPYLNEWQELPKTGVKTPKLRSDKNSQIEEFKIPNLGVPTPKNGSKNSQIEETHKKTNIQKTNVLKDHKEKRQKKEKVEIPDLPHFLTYDMIDEFVEHRKEIKKPMTQRALDLFIKDLIKYYHEGYDIQKCINKAIMGGWQSIHPKQDDKPDKTTHTTKKQEKTFSTMESWLAHQGEEFTI